MALAGVQQREWRGGLGRERKAVNYTLDVAARGGGGSANTDVVTTMEAASAQARRNDVVARNNCTIFVSSNLRMGLRPVTNTLGAEKTNSCPSGQGRIYGIFTKGAPVPLPKFQKLFFRVRYALCFTERMLCVFDCRFENFWF